MKQRGPWRVKGSRIAYKTPWVAVREDAVISPDGRPSIYSTIIIAPGVAIIPLDEEGNIYLAKEYHYAVRRATIKAPGGGIHRGEGRLRAAKRELKEETGIAASRWSYLGAAHPFTAQVRSTQHLYFAQGLRHKKAKPDDTERIDVIKISFKTALRWVDRGKITCPITAMALFKVRDILTSSVGGLRQVGGNGILYP